MTVRELIEHLRGYNPDLPVKVVYLPRHSGEAEHWPVVGSYATDVDEVGETFVALDVETDDDA